MIPPVRTASAEPCPDVEVVFARGTDQPPGLGDIGDDFVEALRARLGPKSLGVYAVDYPATMSFPKAVDGISDAGAHIEQTAAACPKTQMVLGGYSQGAAVMGFVTASQVPDGARVGQDLQPMPAEVANHVAAVALFGKPASQFMSMINQPPVTIDPLYAPKAIELCVPNDPICSGSGDFSAHRLYQQVGMIDQAADFSANRIAEATPPTPSPTPGHGPTATPAPVHSAAPSATPSPTPAPVTSHHPGPPPGPAA
ncbi:cutinase [Mycobacterium florentinum]|uniref:Cutinase n=1 Tax=Mycobacterium florentinum TaxID=292462 RepID=A0A1X1TXB3_MYCFL|nr:cutinase [Mycobacterium florentinum]